MKVPMQDLIYSLSIPAQGRQLIFSDLENTPVYRDALFTGIVDIKTEGTNLCSCYDVAYGDGCCRCISLGEKFTY